jgi:hypothetical protein
MPLVSNPYQITTGNPGFAKCPRVRRVPKIGHLVKKASPSAWLLAKPALGEEGFAKCQALGEETHLAKWPLRQVPSTRRRKALGEAWRHPSPSLAVGFAKCLRLALGEDEASPSAIHVALGEEGTLGNCLEALFAKCHVAGTWRRPLRQVPTLALGEVKIFLFEFCSQIFCGGLVPYL